VFVFYSVYLLFTKVFFTRADSAGKVSANGRLPSVGRVCRCKMSPVRVPSTTAVFVPPMSIPMIVDTSVDVPTSLLKCAIV